MVSFNNIIEKLGRGVSNRWDWLAICVGAIGGTIFSLLQYHTVDLKIISPFIFICVTIEQAIFRSTRRWFVLRNAKKLKGNLLVKYPENARLITELEFLIMVFECHTYSTGEFQTKIRAFAEKCTEQITDTKNTKVVIIKEGKLLNNKPETNFG